MEYTVRANNGRILGVYQSKYYADIAARQSNGYVKSDKDPIYPLREQTKF